MKKIIFYLLIPILLYSCSATNSLTISVTEPAPISLPAQIKKVAVINRTQSSARTNTTDKIDKILSLELLGIDSIAALETIKGLTNELSKNKRFTNVDNLSNILLENSKLSNFSDLLSENQVETICNDNNLDAIFVLEYLDSDTKVDYSVVPVELQVVGIKVNAVETMASVSTNIRMGWRIYDASGDIIYDEYAMFHNVTSTGRGINPMLAISAVTGQKGTIEKRCYVKGGEYAFGLLPHTHRVSRQYYVRGSENFKVGKRRAKAGDWNGASNLWEIEKTNPKAKIAGRAYYNMAIINEINGDLDAAIVQAEISYTDYNNKKALRYLNVLKNRKRKNEELKRQQVE